MSATARVHQIRARSVELPVETPVELAGGSLTSTPLTLIDLVDTDGAIGRSYLRPYSPLALRALTDLVTDLGAELVGSPADPAELATRIPYQLRLLGLHGLVGHALAGIDLAAWDRTARVAGVPLARLLGARTDRVRACVSLRHRDRDAAADEARQAAEAGAAAVKVKLDGTTGGADRELVTAVRSAVGPDVMIMVDFNQAMDPAAAFARVEELDALGAGWIEEPIPGDDLDANAELTRRLHTPLQLGENLEGPQAARRSLAATASDEIMFDAMKIGGVTGWLAAAGFAADAGVSVSSHAYPEVSVHLLAASPAPGWAEYIDHVAAVRREPLLLEAGQLVVPPVPGIGLDWDEGAVAHYLR